MAFSCLEGVGATWSFCRILLDQAGMVGPQKGLLGCLQPSLRKAAGPVLGMVTPDMGQGFARALLVLRKQQKQCLMGAAWRLGASRGEIGPAWASPSGPTNFHLSALEGVVEAFPLGPVDAVGIREVGATQVETIEIGKMAASEPEGS